MCARLRRHTSCHSNCGWFQEPLLPKRVPFRKVSNQLTQFMFLQNTSAPRCQSRKAQVQLALRCQAYRITLFHVDVDIAGQNDVKRSIFSHTGVLTDDNLAARKVVW